MSVILNIILGNKWMLSVLRACARFSFDSFHVFMCPVGCVHKEMALLTVSAVSANALGDENKLQHLLRLTMYTVPTT